MPFPDQGIGFCVVDGASMPSRDHRLGRNPCTSFTRGGALLLGLLSVVSLCAQSTLYWDLNGSTSGAGSAPTGTWNTSTANWTGNFFGTTATTTWTSGSNAVFSAGLDATGSYTVTTSGTQNLSSLTVTLGTPTFTGGTLNFNDSSPDIWTIAGATATINSVIAGSNGITKSGAGTLTLSGSAANTFGGTLRLTDGTVALAKTAGTNAVAAGSITIGDGTGAAASTVLRLDASNQIPNYGGLVTINADGAMRLNNFSESINTLAGTGLVDLSTSGYLGVGANHGSSSFGGSVSGNGTIDKIGSGTLTLTSDLSFGGTLEVSAGSLAYTADHRFNATLKLDGGTLALTNADVSVSSLLVTANSIIDFGGTASSLSLDNLTISNGVTLTIQNWANAADFFFTQAWTGAVFNTTGSNPMNQVVFSGSTSNHTKWLSYEDSSGSGYHQITPVPEPATYGAILLGLLGAFCGSRCRLRATR